MSNSTSIKILAAIAIAISVLSAGYAFVANDRISSLSNQMLSVNTTLTNVHRELIDTQAALAIVRQAYYPMLVEDSLGRVITVQSVPQRIVSCAPSITEMLFALGLGGNVVGADSYSDYPPELIALEGSGNITLVGGVTTLDVEKIASLRPDLVIVNYGLQNNFVQPLEDLGITVMVLKSESIQDVRTTTLLLGKVTGRVTEASALVTGIDNTISEVSARVRGAAPVKVIDMVWLDPMYCAGNGTYINDILTIAGGTNIMGGKAGWVTANPEDILANNPDVIIFDTMELPKSAEEINAFFASLPGFSDVSAVKNGRIYLLTGQAANVIERPGPRVGEAIELVAAILHPEIFNKTVPSPLGDDYAAYVG